MEVVGTVRRERISTCGGYGTQSIKDLATEWTWGVRNGEPFQGVA